MPWYSDWAAIRAGMALLVGAYILSRALEHGWTWDRLKDLFAISVPMGLLAIVLYLPFYVGFQSQAGGILPNLDSPTRGAQLWVMFGPFFLALFAYLVYLWRAEKRPGNGRWGFGMAVGLAVFLWLFSWILAFLALKLQPGLVSGLLASECSGSVAICFTLTSLRRLSYIGGLLTLLALLGLALALLIKAGQRKSETEEPRESLAGHPVPFVLMLITLGAILVIAPEFVFLRDLFVNRMNTIFKFYYQAWWMWSVVADFAVAVLWQKLHDSWARVFRVGLLIVLIMALAYPVFGLPAKTNDFQVTAFANNLKAAQAAGDPAAVQTAARVWTLDGAQLFQTQYPDDAAAAKSGAVSIG